MFSAFSTPALSMKGALVGVASFVLPVSLLSVSLLPALTVVSASAATVPAEQLGTSASTAAGSCWEIKQKRSSAPSGTYWLQTPAMAAPQQFYCDQSTDGGGWVLVGKGRDGWVTDYAGKGQPSALLSPETVPMSSATAQLPSTTVDELLDRGRVDALSDGVRLRRAQTRTGSSWQEVRFRLSKKAGWNWSFGADQPLTSWSFGTNSGRGGQSSSFGTGELYNRVRTTTDSNKNWRTGFGFGSSIAGYTDASSYLWSAANGRGGALPYTQMYLRPRISSTEGYRAIGDAGTPARPRPAGLSSDAMVTPWGVSGLKGSTSPEGSVEVQAFTQSGNKMYVGGNFRHVQRDAAGTGQVEQSFLAAFDVETGEWDPGFRPVLNEQVKALATLPDGTVVAGGTFSRANGSPASAIVALDPTTGATRTGWNLTLENRLSGGVLRVRALDVHGGALYVAGSFTHLSGGNAPTRVVYTRHAAKVDAASATPVVGWAPDFNGTVIDLDASDDGARVYASGYFDTSKGLVAHRVASLSSGGGAEASGPVFNPTWSNEDKNYQQAVQQVGSRVYVGGSEHSLFQFDTSTFRRLASNITLRGGDFQALENDGDLVYGSCHCEQYNYSGATTWRNQALTSSWDSVDSIMWLGLWDARTGEVVPDFAPVMSMRESAGPWAIERDSRGNIWVGGDVTTARTTQGNRFSGGFARFARTDSTPPATPGGFTVRSQGASDVTLAWSPVGDSVAYQLLRGDRTIATVSGGQTTLTVPHGGTERYFVRAVDRAGNIGASTPVLAVGPPAANQPPTAAFTTRVSDRTVTVDGSGSTDDRGVVSYLWNFGDGTTRTGATATHTYAAAGTWNVTLTVADAEGLRHTRAQTVTVTATTTTTVVPNGSTWQWYYKAAAPGARWNDTGFAEPGWSTGAGTFGFGAAHVVTDIDSFADPLDRPLTAYFRKEIQVADPSKLVSLVLDTIGDDGVVLHVNGVEVGRENMRAGAVTHTTYAPTARRHTVAAQSPLVVEVPTSLLRPGVNVIAAETHVNFRRTPDLTFDLKATLVSR